MPEKHMPEDSQEENMMEPPLKRVAVSIEKKAPEEDPVAETVEKDNNKSDISEDETVHISDSNNEASDKSSEEESNSDSDNENDSDTASDNNNSEDEDEESDEHNVNVSELDDDARFALLLQQQELAFARHSGIQYEIDSETEQRLLTMTGLMSPGEGDDQNMSYEALLELEERSGEVKRRGLCDEAINCLKIENWIPSTIVEKTCTICMTDYVEKDELTRLLCEHVFHHECVVGWLRRRATCPVCRDDVPEIVDNDTPICID